MTQCRKNVYFSFCIFKRNILLLYSLHCKSYLKRCQAEFQWKKYPLKALIISRITNMNANFFFYHMQSRISSSQEHVRSLRRQTLCTGTAVCKHWLIPYSHSWYCVLHVACLGWYYASTGQVCFNIQRCNKAVDKRSANELKLVAIKGVFSFCFRKVCSHS